MSVTMIRKIKSRLEPLVKRPSNVNAVISDLFVWRSSPEWDTYFDFIDLPGLFDPGLPSATTDVKSVFFDAEGEILFEKKQSIHTHKRNTMHISKELSHFEKHIGTFAIFHGATPQTVQEAGSFISDRGYISYRYKNSDIRSYMHGNLDAIAYLGDGQYESLVSKCFLKRQYALQFLFEKNSTYEIIIINPTQSKQVISMAYLSAKDSARLNEQVYRLAPRALRVIKLNCEDDQRIIFDSKIPMARPMVYRLAEKHCEVFHG